MTSQALEILNFEQQLQVQDDSFKELSVLDKVLLKQMQSLSSKIMAMPFQHHVRFKQQQHT